MIVIDTNLLIYAINLDSPMYDSASTWLDRQLSGRVDVGLPWLVIVAFLRLTTSQRVFESPLSVEGAIRYVSGWLDLPNVTPLNPGNNHYSILSRLLLRSGTGGNLTSDAHLAAIAVEHGALLCSADNDFKRFQGVQYFNPLEEDGVREPLLIYS